MGRFASGPGLASRENVDRLSAIIETEAGGLNEATKTAVGHTVLNRMRRRDTARVADAERGYVKVTPGKEESRRIATGILAGGLPDPTHGATHFYTPSRMPKENQPTGGRDVGAGLNPFRA